MLLGATPVDEDDQHGAEKSEDVQDQFQSEGEKVAGQLLCQQAVNNHPLALGQVRQAHEGLDIVERKGFVGNVQNRHFN